MSFLNNDFGGSPTNTSPTISPPATISPPMTKLPTIQEMLANMSAFNMLPNPYVQQNHLPVLFPQFPFNPLLHMNPTISQEIIQQFLALTMNPVASAAAMPSNMEENMTTKKRNRMMTKSSSLDSTDESGIVYDTNGDIIVPSHDKEGWCRNKKYIEKTDNGFMCTVCRKVYGRYNSVSYHVTIYHRNPPIKCNLQNCQFTTREARYIHFHKYYRHGIALPQSIDQGSRKCPHCRHVSKSPAMLEKHIRRHQMKEEPVTTDPTEGLFEAMRNRTATICDEGMEVEQEVEEEIEQKPRSCTL